MFIQEKNKIRLKIFTVVFFMFHSLFFTPQYCRAQNASQQHNPLPLAVLKIDEGKKTGKKQHDTAYSRIFFAASIGVGIPGLNFGAPSLYKYNSNNSTDSTHTPGYAKTGFQFNFKGGYYFNENWGAMLQIGGNMNGFNSEEFRTDSYLPQYNYTNVSGTSHYIGSYLAGVVFNMPEGVASTCKKLSMNFHLLAGLMTARYSTVTATYLDSLNVSHTSVKTLNSTSSFAFDLGGGVAYHFSHLIGVNINLDALAGNPQFKGYSNASPGGSQATATYNIGMSTLLINFSIGIVLTLK